MSTGGKIKSLSARRAWIEISTVIVILRKRNVALRKESVDRNFDAVQIVIVIVKSLSARRAWIEIKIIPLSRITRNTVALRKESVDRNLLSMSIWFQMSCRSPQGERG